MSKLLQQMREDRQLRDSAKSVLLADIDHTRSTFSAKGMAERVGGNIGEGVKDVFHTAKIHADDNRGLLALLMGALLLWFARGPIGEILGLEETEHDPAPDIPVENTPLPDGDPDE